MSLDPIVSLSVAIAEAPGSYAFFLGSGVSRDAGVPTGGEVFWNAVGELYRLANASETTPDDDVLNAWLRETGRGDLGYSDVLELIAPDPATRRDYLAKHFEGIAPGPTHTRLADLAHRGLVRVFVTTNFDRLLERALQARGIEPVVVTSDGDLAVAPPREHSSCYVLKPHGDYLQDTIRNTPDELAELEPAMTAQLQEVFDRYGIVVLGYSGSDKAISDGLRARRGRYGLYWIARGALAEPAGSLVEAVAGRVVTRPGAAEFLADLDRRLAVFASHPSGQTPLAVHDETVALLRRGDVVGLRELLREEHRALEATIAGVLDGKQNTQPTVELLEATHKQVLPALERRLGTPAASRPPRRSGPRRCDSRSCRRRIADLWPVHLHVLEVRPGVVRVVDRARARSLRRTATPSPSTSSRPDIDCLGPPRASRAARTRVPRRHGGGTRDASQRESIADICRPVVGTRADRHLGSFSSRRALSRAGDA